MKGGKLIAEGGYGCIFHPGINCDGKEMKTKKYASKIQRMSSSAKNEIQIGNILKNINGYENHFAPIIKHCQLDIAKIKNNKSKTNCSIIKKSKSKDFILMKLRFINGIDFIDYLINQKNSIQIIDNIINSYNHLVRSCQMLVNKSVLHYDIKGTNILFDIDKQHPLLIDFGLSIDMSKKYTQKFLKSMFYVYAPQYYIWPLEIHYLSYLINKTKEPSNDELKEIANLFVKQNTALQKNFSKDFLEKYNDLCLKQLVKYNEIKFDERINKIMKYWKTFDNYSISIMYLKFLKVINVDGFKNNKFIIFFSELLLQNIHPNPDKRLSLINTIHTFNAFLYEKNLKNITTFAELTDGIVKNRQEINENLYLQKKKGILDTKTMKILQRKQSKKK